MPAVKTSGGKCGCPALRGRLYCYFHTPAPGSAEAGGLTNLEDCGAIHHAITQVAKAVADHRIETRRASLILYALQIASTNVKKADAKNSELTT